MFAPILHPPKLCYLFIMENQSKVKKILLSIWLAVATVLSVIFIIVCIVGGVQSSKNNKHSASAYVEHDIVAFNINNDINKRVSNPIIKKAVSYDDSSYTITLNSVELSDYVFDNLYNYVVSIANNTNIGVASYDNYSNVNIVRNNTGMPYELPRLYIELVANSSGNIVIYFNDERVDQEHTFFMYQSGQINQQLFFESDLSLALDSTYYNDFKNAIELDIQANSVSMNDSIFNTLSSSTVGFIGTISSGISTMISVFWSNNSLTVVGTLAVIVVAVSLSYFLFRLIFGLIRMRG